VSARVPICLLLAAALTACGGGGGGGHAAGGSTPTPERTPSLANDMVVAPAAAARRDPADWPTFDVTPSRTGVFKGPTPIRAGNVARLHRQQVSLPGTVDNAPIYFHRVRVAGKRRNVFVMTTTYGKTLAVDAANGRILWTFTPRGYSSWARTAQITQAAPTADSDRRHVFAASPDGRLHRLTLSNGREVRRGRWPVSLTRDPRHEKLTSSLNLIGNRLVMTTGGYIGDAPPYQGHVVELDRASGRILAVFNSLCANVRRIQSPPSCSGQLSAIWGRGGAVLTPRHTVLVSTGNGPYDGRRNFGDSVIELSLSGLRLRRSWAPDNQRELEEADADLGSVSPVVVPGGVLQSGKFGVTDVLSVPALRRVQEVRNPGRTAMFSAPAVWTRHGRTTVFATTASATEAWSWRGHRLQVLWSSRDGGTSPMLAGGLLYVFKTSGQLIVRNPNSGAVLARLPAGRGHWNSPIVGGGVVALPEGNGNDHSTTGSLSLYRLP
jgi:outer membrane protein assembly factor BamB